MMAAPGRSPHLPPGFKFRPSDEELASHYLLPRSTYGVVAEADILEHEPWELPGQFWSPPPRLGAALHCSSLWLLAQCLPSTVAFRLWVSWIVTDYHAPSFLFCRAPVT